MDLQELSLLEDRYWEKVDVRGENECWEWTASLAGKGYGHLVVHGNRTLYAHRMAWELEYGPIPDGMFVCHKCDNPRCVNPRHLFLGTAADNTQDMVKKNRSARGTRNGQAKLTRKQVREIRRLYTAGKYTQQMVAERFNISGSQVSHIIARRRWGWCD